MVREGDVDQDAWSCWHPQDLAQRLRGISAPWCVVGGWALDLWHGRQTREHDDLEFTILPGDLPHFRRALNGLELFSASDGIIERFPDDADLSPTVWQLWCWDRDEQCWRADMMIERGTSTTWVYKRDPAITCPRTEITQTTETSIPYLSPVAVLLFKAKYRRQKDDFDFDAALPKLTAAERIQLRSWLERQHPGHAWIGVL